MTGSTEAFTAAGSSLSVCASAPSANTKSGYEALSWTEIGEITDFGTLGRVYNFVDFLPVSTRGKRKIKGSYDDGTQTVQMGYAPGDPGQVILNAGIDDDDFYSFKLELQDGTIKYYRAQVGSNPQNIGGPDTIVGSSVQLSVKSGSIITVLPA